MANPNRDLLLSAARMLEPLLGDLVFVGGCATALLITDEAAADVRPTKDVDVIAEVSSRSQYGLLSKRLRACGFREDAREGAPICRWWHPDDITVDVMPTDERILGFSNPWYRTALRTAVALELEATVAIRLVTAPVFCATKIAAFRGRGKADYAASHDLEDFIAVVDGRIELAGEMRSSEPDLRLFVAQEVAQLLRTARFRDAQPGYLLPDAASQARLPLLLTRLRAIAEIEP